MTFGHLGLYLDSYRRRGVGYQSLIAAPGPRRRADRGRA